MWLVVQLGPDEMDEYDTSPLLHCILVSTAILIDTTDLAVYQVWSHCLARIKLDERDTSPLLHCIFSLDGDLDGHDESGRMGFGL